MAVHQVLQNVVDAIGIHLSDRGERRVELGQRNRHLFVYEKPHYGFREFIIDHAVELVTFQPRRGIVPNFADDERIRIDSLDYLSPDR